jgi:hypothetical protein
MSPRAGRRLVLGYFALYAVALTYPGVAVVNRIAPRILGLPPTLFWVVLWVALSFPVLWLGWRAEARGRGEE